jgi:hypothetical protein
VEEEMHSLKKLLVDDAEACEMLSIPAEHLDWLVRTEQLIPINIRGRRLFAVRQLEELVRTYSIVQARGKADAQNDSQ